MTTLLLIQVDYFIIQPAIVLPMVQLSFHIQNNSWEKSNLCGYSYRFTLYFCFIFFYILF